MNQTKWEMPLYSFYSYTAIQRHLEKRAMQGWRLIKADKGGWLYRRMDPKPLHYAVVYFPDSSQFDPGPTEGQQTLRDYCLAAGWEPVTDWAQAQIYCNPQPDPVPIETEPAVQLNVIRQTMCRSFLPAQILNLVLFLFLTGMQLSDLYWTPDAYLSSPTRLWLLALLALGVLTDLAELLGYGLWVLRSRRSIARGGGCVSAASHPWLTRCLLAAMGLVLLLQMLFSGTSSSLVFMPLYLLGMAGIFVLTGRIQRRMKEKKFSRRANRAITLTVCALLAVAMMSAWTAGLFLTLRSGAGQRPPAETYEVHGQTWEVYHDPLPLRLEDLTTVDSRYYSSQLTASSTPLLTRWEVRQRSRFDAPKRLPDLEYTLVFCHFPALQSMVEQGFLRQAERWNKEIPAEHRAEHGSFYRPADAAAWGADRVYQKYSGSEPVSTFLLCWEDRVAEVNPFGWELTEAQMAAAGAALKQVSETFPTP